MSESEIHYDSDKIHVHRWPRDSPIWDEPVQKEIDDQINKNPNSIPVTFKEKTITIGKIEFYSLKKIGISVPFFKKQCTVIFEGQFGVLFAHVHVTVKSENYVDVFTQLTLWKNKFFPNDS